MDKIKTSDKQKYIFGSLFLLPNKLQAILDQILSVHDITAKQWFLTAIIEEFFDAPPTLSEVSETMGTSHQNVKQIALKLQKKDFLHIEQDEKDRRAIRLKLTEKSSSFWEERNDKSKEFLAELFKDLNEEEIDAMFNGISKLYEKILKINESIYK